MLSPLEITIGLLVLGALGFLLGWHTRKRSFHSCCAVCDHPGRKGNFLMHINGCPEERK
jgi:hypothetical protein